MAKFFETSESLKEIIENEFDKTNLALFNVDLKIMSVKKSKDLISVSKANPTTSYLTHTEDMVVIQVFEEIFDRLDKRAIEMIVEMAFVNVWFDTEKDKLNVEKNQMKALFAMRKKYGNEFIDVLESGYLAIEQLAEEQKEKKGE